MKKKLIICLFCIAAIVAAVFFFLPMIQEQRAYSKVKNEENIEACLKSCDSYEKEWPEGKHLEDVLFRRVEIAKDDGTCVNEICKYLRQFPEGKYVKDVNDRWDEIWDKEIKKYEDNDKSEGSTDGTFIMMEMLQYMKQQRINTLLLGSIPTLDIKDFDEYDEDIQSLIERTNETSLPYKEGIVSVKSNYDDKSAQALNDILVENLQQRMDEVFSPGFIRVVAANKAEDVSLEKTPFVSIDYKVMNIEMDVNDKTYPQIWSYPTTEDDEEDANPDGFLMGLFVYMSIKISVPELSKFYIYEESDEITDYLKDVKNLKEGYKEMTSFFFQEQIGKFAKKLGL